MENQENSRPQGKVLVVGGGMGGIRTALDLAEADRDVVLADTAVSIGGLMTQLDRTFPTNNCDLCTLSPHLSATSREQRIDLRTMTRVQGVTGEVGNFTVTLTTKPRHIDLEKCTACGDCHEKMPECVSFTPGLDHRAPTCMRYPQATPQAFAIDLEKCTDRDGLVKLCPAGAIVLDETEQTTEETFGAIVVAPGADVFDPSNIPTLGYSQFGDMVTSLEYERILSASGPTGGKLLRPSDGTQPKRIAWIQCTGSRGRREGLVPYCSSACCMFALKEAIVTKERFPEDVETTVFYMDMRTSGKDYELYYQRAKNEVGVRFVRCRTQNVIRNEETNALALTYIPDKDDHVVTEDFDMVVLSTGFRMGDEARGLASELGIELNEHGFARAGTFTPVETSKPGVYVCGLFESPKDIPLTITQASAAAAMAAGCVAPSELDEEAEELPPERDVSGEEPRVGVFTCDCGDNIGNVIDVQKLAADVGKLPGVELSEVVGHGCSRESTARIQEAIEEHNLNRVVIGGCSPRTHETRFQDVIRRAGLNKYLVEIANLRDQDTWVHREWPEAAALKANELLRMAVAGVKRARPLTDKVTPMNRDILVVGGGVAGMSAALSLGDQGFKVYLVEQSNELGGLAKDLRKTLEGEDVRAGVKALIERTEAHESVQVIKGAIIVDHSGMPGLFKTGMQVGPQMFYRQIEHGATIIATGALPRRPSLFLLDENELVHTHRDADSVLEDQPDVVKGWEKVVMIQCVGSRTAENPNCSRVCCQAAVKNALRILDINPDARIYVLYRDMRTYGFQEDYYREARRRGVIFVRYEEDAPPQVEALEDKIRVTFHDPILGQDLALNADQLLLGTGFAVDDESNEDLALIFKLPRTTDGFFLEDHIKLRPVDLPVPGFFIAGTAHGPKTVRGAVAQGLAVAARAMTLLARGVLETNAAIAKVDGDRCAACLVCVRACPFDVPYINADGYSEIDPTLCHGCGVCAAECPAKAIQLMTFEDDHIMAKLEGLLERMIA